MADVYWEWKNVIICYLCHFVDVFGTECVKAHYCAIATIIPTSKTILI